MTSSVSLRVTLGTLMKDISDGLQLDRADRFEDAYRKYLECLLRITTTLLKKLHSDGGHLMVSSDLFKTVKLATQCMDRVSAIVGDKYVPVTDEPKKSRDSMSLSLTSLNSVGSGVTPLTPSPRGVVYTQESTTSTPSPSFKRKISKTPSQEKPSKQAQDKAVLVSSLSGDKMSPMAMASRQNQQLLLAFKARQAQTQNRKDKSLSVNLSLTLQRKMAENLAIAKAQEEALAKKMLERQARLEEQAARRFGMPVGLSAEEQHQREIFRRVLQFELEQPTMTDIKNRFEENPTDFELISQLLSAILSCEKHPLTEQLKCYQEKVLDRLQPLVCKKIPLIENVNVPLDKDLYQLYKVKFKVLIDEKLKDDSSEMGRSVDNVPEDLDEDLQETEHESEKDIENETECKIVRKERNDFNENNGNSAKEEVAETEPDNAGLFENETGFEKAVEDVQKDIETAESRCDKLRKSLESENESFKSMALYSAGQYDKYIEENMDDLFDDDEDDIVEPETGNATKDEAVIDENDNDFALFYDEFNDLKVAAYKRHLKGIVEDILTSIEHLAVLFVVVYDKLNTAEGKDHCNAKLEASFFRPLWKYLLALFRLSNSTEELKLAGIMTDKQNCDPMELDVRDKLCLTPPTADSTYPYEPAVTELLNLVGFHTMLEKLECIVRASKLVMQCVEQYYANMQTQAPSIGADDLVPVLCYIVVRSGLPQIVSECQAMERFLHEGYMFGEEGYCLTSFQTAIDYLTSSRCQTEP